MPTLHKEPGFSLTLPIIVLILAVSATIFVWRQATMSVNSAASIRFENEVGNIEREVVHRIESYEKFLLGVRSLFNSSTYVGYEEWHQYFHGLGASERLPGMIGFAYAPYLLADEAAGHQETVGRPSNLPPTVKLPGDRMFYMPVTYVYPRPVEQTGLLGFDLASEPTRLAAIERAMVSGEPTLSDPLVLTTDSTDSTEISVLFVVPLYERENPDDPLRSDRGGQRGVVVSGFRLEPMLRDVVLDELSSFAKLKIYDGTVASDDTLLFSNWSSDSERASTNNALPKQNRVIEVGGQKWLLAFESTDLMANSLDFSLPKGIVITGGLLSLTLFALSWSLALTRARSRKDSKRRLELQSSNEHLDELRKEAEQANQAKSSFLATMSHEIRTPMNGVIGMVEVLGESSLTEDQNDALHTIKQSSFALLNLIDEILDFSKIEAGKLELEEADVDIEDVLSHVCTAFSPLAHQKDVNLSFYAAPEDAMMVRGDNSRIRQIFNNLISNAVKFTSAQMDERNVRLSIAPCLSDPHLLQVMVTDSGVGIAPEALQTIFDPFTQAEISTTRQFGGTGLGLTISKRLVDIMNGTLTVESELGKGTTFTVTLARSSNDSQAENRQWPDFTSTRVAIVDSGLYESDRLADMFKDLGASVSQHQDVGEAIGGLVSSTETIRHSLLIGDHASCDASAQGNGLETSSGVPIKCLLLSSSDIAIAQSRKIGTAATKAGIYSSSGLFKKAWQLLNDDSAATERVEGLIGTERPVREAWSVAEARAKGTLILVAEDDPINQKVLLKQLTLLGHTAEVAENGEIAFELWKCNQYAMLLTDLNMPKMDGYTLSRNIRKRDLGERRAPILMLTANAIMGEEQAARAVGIDDYLTKPIQLSSLRAALDRWLPLEHQTQEAAAMDDSPKPDQAIIDIGELRKLVGDDSDLIHELLRDYRDHLRKSMVAFSLAIESGHVADATSIAHRLKSSSRSVGAMVLGDLCADMENLGKSHDIKKFADTYLVNAHLFDEVLVAAERIVSQANNQAELS